jgi:ankyrin repeat protein
MNERFQAALTQVDDGDPGVLLRAAAYHGHVELVRYLLQRGADPRLENREGHTALHFAQEQHHAEIVKLLEGPAAHDLDVVDETEPER